MGGRLVCPKCGSNNFDTVSACWKCGGALNSGAAPASPVQPQRAYTPTEQTPSQPQANYSPYENVAYRAAAAVNTLGDAAKANRAAFWLGMLMPYFGLPIGLAFMMCNDRQKQEVGRLCIIWSVISGIIHFLFTVASMIGMSRYLAGILPALRASAGRGGMGGGMGGGMDGM